MDFETSLWNPYSRATCFIIKLYRMEFGNPPLYFEINKSVRDMDMSHLEYFGPIQRVLNEITLMAENKKDMYDKLEVGDHIQKVKGGVAFNLAGTFMLWMGDQMEE